MASGAWPGERGGAIRVEASKRCERAGGWTAGAEVLEANEGLLGGGTMTRPHPPQHDRRTARLDEPAEPTTDIPAEGGAIDELVEVLIGPPGREVDDQPLVTRGQHRGAIVRRRVAPHEPGRPFGEPVDRDQPCRDRAPDRAKCARGWQHRDSYHRPGADASSKREAAAGCDDLVRMGSGSREASIRLRPWSAYARRRASRSVRQGAERGPARSGPGIRTADRLGGPGEPEGSDQRSGSHRRLGGRQRVRERRPRLRADDACAQPLLGPDP